MNDLRKHITGLQHVGIPTNDLEATLRFYESLGFELCFRAGTPREPVAFLELQGLMIETYQNGQAAGKAGAVDHIAMDVDDIQAVYRAVSGMGYAAVEGKLCELPFWENGVQFFTIAGPNGEKIEFSQKR